MSVRNDVVNLIVNVNGNQAQAQLNDLRKRSGEVKNEMLGLKKGTEEYIAKAKELKAVGAEMDKLKKDIGLTALSQKELNAELNKLKALKGNVSPMSAEFKQLDQQIKAVVNRLNEVRNSGKGFSDFLSKAAPSLTGIGIAGAAAMGVQMISEGVKAFVSFNAEFEKSVANLSAITGATGKDLEYLKNAAIDMSASSTRSAKDYVEAMKLIASAKPELLTQKEALVQVTQAASTLADASGLELPDAATRLTDALNQFGASARQSNKYIDALAAGAKYGAAEIPDITDALLQFGTQAKSSNISIYESTAAIELLAEKGQKGAEAGVKLRNVLLAMNAVDGLDKKALKSLEDAGVNTDKLKDKSLSLGDRLTELSKVSDNASALVNIFGKENFNAAQIVLQNIDRYKQLATQVKEVGVAHEQAITNTDTLIDSWERLKNVASSEFLKEGGSFTTFLKNIVKFGEGALKTLGNVVRMATAVITFDFGKLGNLRKNFNANKTEDASNKAVGAVIDYYSNDENGRERSKQDLLKKLRANGEEQYKIQKEAAAKGDIKRHLEYYNNYKTTMKAVAIIRKEIETTPNAVAEIPPVVNNGGKTGGKTDGKKSLIDRGADALKQRYEKLIGNLTSEKLDELDIAFNAIQTTLDEKKAVIDAMLKAGKIDQQTAKKDYANVINEATQQIEKATDEFAEKALKNRKPYTIVEPIKVKPVGGVILDDTDIVAKIGKKESTAKLKIDVLRSPVGTAKNTDAQLKLLELEKEEVLKNHHGTETEKDLITAEFDKKRADIKAAAIQAAGDFIVKQATTINGLLNAIENRQLAKETAIHDKKKKDLDKQLKGKLISQEQYNLKTSQLDDELDKKKKKLAYDQAKRQKAIDIASGLASTALAVIGFLTAKPVGPWNIPQAVIAGAMGLAQVATIAAQPLPELGDGGWIKTGDKHNAPSRGIKTLIERDEAVVNAATMTDKNSYTVTGTPAQITSALNGMNGVSWAPGATFAPSWRTKAPQYISPMMPKIMAMGGVAYASQSVSSKPSATTSTDTTSVSNDEMPMLTKQILEEQKQMRAEISTWATTLQVMFSNKEYERFKTNLDNAKKQSGISGR
jgi:TP901 family phage tail tape measure protein